MLKLLTSRTPPTVGFTAALDTKISIPPNFETACNEINIQNMTMNCILIQYNVNQYFKT